MHLIWFYTVCLCTRIYGIVFALIITQAFIQIIPIHWSAVAQW